MILFTMRVTASVRQRYEILRTLRSLAATTSGRRGCVSVHILQDVDNRSTITWTEEWDSEDDLTRHIRSDEYRALLAVIDMSTREPEIRFQTISRTAGMEWIAANRLK
jgi:quinol monooxygenase YgiN